MKKVRDCPRHIYLSDYLNVRQKSDWVTSSVGFSNQRCMLWMVLIFGAGSLWNTIGASSLWNTIGAQRFHERRQSNRRTFSDGGLSFNSQNQDKGKVLKNFLNRGSLLRKKNIVIWHILNNNTISQYRKSESLSSPVVSLFPIPDRLSILKSLKDRIATVVCIESFKTRHVPNILEVPKLSPMTHSNSDPSVDKTRLIKRKQNASP